MAWIFDEYTKFAGFSPGIVTGKVRAGVVACVCAAAMDYLVVVVGWWRRAWRVCVWCACVWGGGGGALCVSVYACI